MQFDFIVVWFHLKLCTKKEGDFFGRLWERRIWLPSVRLLSLPLLYVIWLTPTNFTVIQKPLDNFFEKLDNPNFPFLSFFFSFSAWFQDFWGGGCWSNVIFNAFTFKKSSRVCIYSHCTLPTLETLRVFKIGTITELCSLSGVQERSMISLHNLQHSGFATIDYNWIICFSRKFCVFFCSPAVSVALYSQTLVKNLVWRAWVQCSSFLANLMLNGFLLLSRICLLFRASEEMTV